MIIDLRERLGAVVRAGEAAVYRAMNVRTRIERFHAFFSGPQECIRDINRCFSSSFARRVNRKDAS